MPKISIPTVSSPLAPDMQAFVQRVREAFSLFKGGVITQEDLERASIIRTTPGGGIIPGPATNGEIDYTPPPAPTGFTATAALATVILDWDTPTYHNHSYTEIWRATANNLGSAVMIGTTDADLYADAVGATGVTYYYWVRFRSSADVVGPYNATAGSTAQTGKVGNSDLGPLIVEAANLATNAVTSTKIENNAVVAGKIAANAIVAGDGAIQNAAITNALIANLAVDSAKLANLAVVEAKIGDGAVTNAKIGNIIQSSNYVPGTSGWIINKDGTAEFSSASFRGGVWTGDMGVTVGAGGSIKGGATAYATGTGFWMGADAGIYKFSLGNASGAHMTWDGSTFTIYDSGGAVVLASGSGVPWAKVSGTGKPADNATVGANASNLATGIGANLIPNSDLALSQGAWMIGWDQSGAGNYTISRDSAGDDWRPSGGHTIGVARINWPNQIVDVVNNINMSVVAGARYELSGRVAAHRCTAQILVVWYNAAGTWLAENVTTASAWSGGRDLANWDHQYAFFTAPAGASFAKVSLRTNCTGGYADAFGWLTQVMFCRAGAGQTEPSAWSPSNFAEQITSSNVATYIANAAIGNAQIGGDIYSTNYVYNVSGWLLQRNGSLYCANAFVRGDVQATSLNAATGTFSGTMTADAVNAVNTINLAGNSVTIPVVALTTGYIQPEGLGETTLQSAYIDAGGAIVLVVFAFTIQSYDAAGTTNCTWRIKAPSGTVLATDDVSIGPLEKVAVSFACSSTEAGTYMLTAVVNGNAYSRIRNRVISLFGAKR